ncbi:fasciclin domain-containing protein, partial [Streptomyces sp. NPDC055808]
MNALRFRRTAIVVTAAATLPFALSACGGSDSKKDSSASSEAATPPASQSTTGGNSSNGDASMTDKPFGTACASVPKDGAGSFDGMAKDP